MAFTPPLCVVLLDFDELFCMSIMISYLRFEIIFTLHTLVSQKETPFLFISPPPNDGPAPLFYAYFWLHPF